MPISDIAIRNAKPQNKAYKLRDEKNLYLIVTPQGGKLWRFDYRYGGKRKTLSMGIYPDVSLAQARNKRDDARKLLSQGIDPSETRKAQKAAQTAETDTFEVVAREWFSKFKSTWVQGHADRILIRLEKDIFPWLGNNQIATINAPQLLKCLRRIEERGALNTAHRAKQICGQVFRYAIATGRAERDPSQDLRGALPPANKTHFAAITDPKAIGELLRAIEGYKGQFVTRCALKLAPYVFVRPGELRKAEWSEIDLDAEEWRIPAERMKMGSDHIVPLASQTLTILRELHPLTGNGRYVFPSPRTLDRPMSDNAILVALRRMGISNEEMTGHGFRSMARTVLDEVLGFRVDYIEHQLAHAVKDTNGRAYNRTAHLPERRKMMQAWADYLDSLKQGAQVIPIKRAR